MHLKIWCDEKSWKILNFGGSKQGPNVAFCKIPRWRTGNWPCGSVNAAATFSLFFLKLINAATFTGRQPYGTGSLRSDPLLGCSPFETSDPACSAVVHGEREKREGGRPGVSRQSGPPGLHGSHSRSRGVCRTAVCAIAMLRVWFGSVRSGPVAPLFGSKNFIKI